MKPNAALITIDDNENKIQTLLQELVLQPRLKALAWSKITKQTPNMKIGYPGQHLASLITGIEGARTGARGDDLRDGSEVKSCSRVDQLDTCLACGEKVLRIEATCPHCQSDKIKRMDDSKWLFSVKTEQEVKLLTQDIGRVFLTIADYPSFTNNDFSIIRFQAYELWNNTERHKHFRALMTNYYYKIFLEHIKKNASKTPAPKNFWPYSFQFYLCNPVKVFNCIVSDANTDPKIRIDHYVRPADDRSVLVPEPMPIDLLSTEELVVLAKNVPEEIIVPQLLAGNYNLFVKTVSSPKPNRELLSKMLPFIDEQTRGYITLRDTDIISTAKAVYSRR